MSGQTAFTARYADKKVDEILLPDKAEHIRRSEREARDTSNSGKVFFFPGFFVAFLPFFVQKLYQYMGKTADELTRALSTGKILKEMTYFFQVVKFSGKREKKMKKSMKICVALTLLLTVALTGCGLFGESSDKGSGKTDAISLLDGQRTYKLPDVDYDTLYLCQIDVNPDDENALLSEFLDYGIQKEYHLTYAKDGKAIRQDDIFICDTGDNAQAMYDALMEMGGGEGMDFAPYEGDPSMLVLVYNQEMVEGTILQFAGYGIGLEADADAATYAQFDADIYAGYLVDVTPVE